MTARRILPRGFGSALLSATLITATGCALRTPTVSGPPQGVPIAELEARAARDLSDVDAVVSLVSAYLQDERLEDARAVLERALGVVPGERTLLAAHGVVQHRLGLAIEALDSYEAFLAAFQNDAAFSDVQARLEAVRPRAQLSEARLRVADAGSVRARVVGRQVAVVPFARDPTVPGLGDLSVAVADFVARDLAAASLDVTDPAAVRALVEAGGVPVDAEMTLDEVRGVASLLGAGRVLYGTVETQGFGDLLLRGTVVGFDGDSVAIVGFALRGSLSNLPTLGRRLAMLAVEGMSGNIDADVAAVIAASPVTGLPVLEVMGRGLTASARGDHAASAEAFGAAVALDPAFTPAAELSQRARRAITTEAEPPITAILELARVGALVRAVTALDGSSSFEGAAAAARERRALAEILGQDGLVKDILIELVLTVPGAAP